ncbi:formate/nitrite transporter family protein [Clostridium folliculivorans]|uniref:Transporter n=1 Tax=Clostridium folliculivorans TaxID=2886038 RepID=A0A9W6DCP7_9CLOT|nr:formate/nitrite transporter family protein [Clostridium folliculivorans]GKU26958.1 transporter [Clostridium folliculivorans]GKU29200.1 transporter [Clostridium folliculivorans]
MYKDDIKEVAHSSEIKSDYINDSVFKYFLLAFIAGFFVIVGIALSYSTAGIVNVDGKLYGKMAVGLTFSIALGLIYFAGGELFTGNCFVLTVGLLEKTISLKDTIKLLVVCYLGNLAGSIVSAYIYVKSGAPIGLADTYLLKVAESKTHYPSDQLFLRAILCNFIVCLAVWLCYRLKEETAKLIMLFWCIFAFATAGFEHSVANMALFSAALMLPDHGALTLGAVLHNLGWVTLGNILGGSLFLAVPYWYVSQGNTSKDAKVK